MKFLSSSRGNIASLALTLSLVTSGILVVDLVGASPVESARTPAPLVLITTPPLELPLSSAPKTHKTNLCPRLLR